MSDKDDSFEVFPELDEELLRKKLFPVIVRPNLGIPDFIGAKNYNIDDMETKAPPSLLDFEFEGLIAACDQSSMDDIFHEMDNRIFVYPLSEELVRGRAIRLNKIPVTIKEIRKTSIVRIDKQTYNNNPQVYLETEKVFPGREIWFQAKFLFRAPFEIFNPSLDIGTEPLSKKEVRKHVLCDLVYDLTEEETFEIDHCDDNYIKYYCKNGAEIPKKIMRINYHSLVLSLKLPEQMHDFNMWHATDLHIAARNDKIPHSIFKRMKKKGMREKDLEKGKEAVNKFQRFLMTSYSSDEKIKSINARIKDDRCFAFSITDDETPYIHDPEDIPYSDDNFYWKLPVEYRAQNFNNNLRMFIYQANDAYKRGELDFIVLTGDLVDFVSPRRFRSYEFKYSNWKVFLDILLGKPIKNENAGLLQPEEILVPIYSLPGNHDYRGHSYPPTFGNEMLGFTNEEMKLYPSSRLTYFRAIYANIKYLRGYFQFINPELNFAKKFGKTHLIFLDSDKDTLIDFYDIIKGSPSTQGFRDPQMNWLRNYCDKNVSDDETIIMATHAPPLNPPKIEVVRDKIEKVYPELKELEDKTGEPKINIRLLDEYHLIDKFDDPRVDQIVNLKFGTILRNWEEILEFCLNCKRSGINKRVNLVLSGHSHKNLEFRLQTLRGREITKTPYIEILPFKKVNVPCAVYIGNYSMEYMAEIKYLNSLSKDARIRRLANHNLITNKFPFLAVTTALGPRSQREYSNLQAFRKIQITEDRIDSFAPETLLRYFAPFELISQKKKEKPKYRI
ncbi:MAG: hypothetical protein GF364_07300 [Candidatus Lokiarchaeota archaeon]|nr:hypothetical protein [Candidatus Lokiarchaeota archaeon]